MSYKVKIQNKKEILVDTGNTILEAALEQGIDFPHGCKTGNCGACKSEKISGDIEMSPYSEFALEAEEIMGSLKLAEIDGRTWNIQACSALTKEGKLFQFFVLLIIH